MALIAYWQKVYRKHKNEIDDIWNQERDYYKETRHVIYGENCIADSILEEHLDLVHRVSRTPKSMVHRTITEKEIEQY